MATGRKGQQSFYVSAHHLVTLVKIQLENSDELCRRVLLRRQVAELEKAEPTVTGGGGMRMSVMASLSTDQSGK